MGAAHRIGGSRADFFCPYGFSNGIKIVMTHGGPGAMSDAPADDPSVTYGWGGVRPGAGRKPKPRILSPPPLRNSPPLSPLAFLLETMNDVTQPPGRRIRCAIAAAPYV